VEIVRDHQPKLIVLDTQARMTPGLEENSAKEVGLYVAAVDLLRRASGACVLTVHHSSKGAAYLRGSSALMGAADTVVALARPDELQPVIGVRNVKQKDDRQRPEYWLRPVDQANGSVTLVECECPDWWGKRV
jgi:RecA-family ATPase